jgi:serine/threonine protein kinase
VGNSKLKNDLIYLIDFGLSKRFRDEKTGEHILYRDNLPFIGNSRFASIYTHLGIEQSRRDDLISIAYIILYFYNGYLPWQGIKCKTISEKNQKVFQKKISLKSEEIFKGVPGKRPFNF